MPTETFYRTQTSINTSFLVFRKFPKSVSDKLSQIDIQSQNKAIEKFDFFKNLEKKEKMKKEKMKKIKTSYDKDSAEYIENLNNIKNEYQQDVNKLTESVQEYQKKIKSSLSLDYSIAMAVIEDVGFDKKGNKTTLNDINKVSNVFSKHCKNSQKIAYN